MPDISSLKRVLFISYFIVSFLNNANPLYCSLIRSFKKVCVWLIFHRSKSLIYFPLHCFVSFSDELRRDKSKVTILCTSRPPPPLLPSPLPPLKGQFHKEFCHKINLVDVGPKMKKYSRILKIPKRWLLFANSREFLITHDYSRLIEVSINRD